MKQYQPLPDFKTKTKSNFEMEDGFKRLERHIDQLAARWGIRDEVLFRETMTDLLEESFGVAIERQHIAGKAFDVIISNGDHILVEIKANVKRNIVECLQQKLAFYIKKTGITPSRFILAVGNIYSRRAMALRESGFNVIEPNDDDDGYFGG